jgi:xylulose-5-phosphate/fructose-6-phosphate phosphoketolase
MSANLHANGGLLKRALRLPDFRRYGLRVDKPGQFEAGNTRPLGSFLRDVMKLNMNCFRVFGPDENTSNKLHDIYEVSKKFWIAEYFPEDADGGEIATDGRTGYRDAQRTHRERNARGLPADRSARVPFFL